MAGKAANTTHHNFTARRLKHQLSVRGTIFGRCAELKKKERDLTGYSASEFGLDLTAFSEFVFGLDEDSDDEFLSALREARELRESRAEAYAEEEDACDERVPFEPP